MTIKELRLQSPHRPDEVLIFDVNKTEHIKNLFQKALEEHKLSLSIINTSSGIDFVELAGKTSSYVAEGFKYVEQGTTLEGEKILSLTTGRKESRVNFETLNCQKYSLIVRR